MFLANCEFVLTVPSEIFQPGLEKCWAVKMAPILLKSELRFVTRIFTDSENTFGSEDTISKQLTQKCRQNIISLFCPDETLCEVSCISDRSKCTFMPFEVFASHTSRI